MPSSLPTEKTIHIDGDGMVFDASYRLCVTNLACQRGGRLLFDELSFTLNAGQGLILTGPNGAGKTSLMRILAGLLTPASGSVTLEAPQGIGIDLPTSSDAFTDIPVGEFAHFAGARDALKPALTAAEHIEFWQALHASDLKGRVCQKLSVQDVLMRAGISDLAQTVAAHLSSGQRRRLSLARLYTGYRPIWLLDEPLNALDARARAAWVERLQRFHAAGGRSIVATHVPVELPEMLLLDLKRDMRDISPQVRA